MENPGGMCRCMKNATRCLNCTPDPALDLSAALNELGSLSRHHDLPAPGLSERRQRAPVACFEQSPPAWVNNPTSSTTSFFGLPLCLDMEQPKEIPLQPPNSPVSPKLPFEHFRTSPGEPLPQRCEWDGRLLGGRRVNLKGRQRMLSGPHGSTNSSSNGSTGLRDRSSFLERLRDRSGWRPYRIPRPKLVNMGQTTRVRTISATLHEEAAETRLAPIIDTSPAAVTADSLRCMSIEEAFSKTTLDNGECSLNFPRSRSAENLERRALDVASNTLDSVSDKIEKLHVT